MQTHIYGRAQLSKNTLIHIVKNSVTYYNQAKILINSEGKDSGKLLIGMMMMTISKATSSHPQ